MTGTSLPSGSVAVARAGVGQAGGLPDRQRVHVGAQHDRGAIAVGQQPDHAGAADALGDLVAGGLEALCRLAGGAVLLHRELGVRVDVAVEVLEPGRDLVEPAEDTVGWSWPSPPSSADAGIVRYAGRADRRIVRRPTMVARMDVPHGFDPTLILVLNLVGTFIFGLSGGLAAVRARSTSSASSCSRPWWAWPAGSSATC